MSNQRQGKDLIQSLAFHWLTNKNNFIAIFILEIIVVKNLSSFNMDQVYLYKILGYHVKLANEISD